MRHGVRALLALLAVILSPAEAAHAYTFVLQMTGRVACYTESVYPVNCPAFGASTGYGGETGQGIGDFTARFVLDTDAVGVDWGDGSVLYEGATSIFTAGSWTNVAPFYVRMFAQTSPVGNESCYQSGLPGTGLLFGIGTTTLWMSDCKRAADQPAFIGGLALEALATQSLAYFTGWTNISGIEGIVQGDGWRVVAFIDSIRRMPEPGSLVLCALGLLGLAATGSIPSSGRAAKPKVRYSTHQLESTTGSVLETRPQGR